MTGADAPPPDGARRLAASPRAHVWALDGPGGRGVVVKLAAADAVAREAVGLARVAGCDLAPPLVSHGRGVLVTEHLDGEAVPFAHLTTARARTLGAALARLHGVERSPTGAYDGWDAPERTLDAYRRRRARDSTAHHPAPVPPPAGDPADAPFVMVHGDLWSGNTLWQGDDPRFVDWEYHRMGDAAEEVAYAAAMDDVPHPLVREVLRGYGAPELEPAVLWWRPLLARECAGWFAAEGDAERAAALRAQARRLAGDGQGR